MTAVQSIDSRETRGSIVRRVGSVQIDISSDDDLSEAFFTDWCTGGVGIQLPTIDTGTAVIHVSADGTTYVPLVDKTGAAIGFASGTGGEACNFPEAAGWHSIKIATAQQASDRTILITAYDAQ
jgi:hypothetical protein